jgi:hypothetical protein
MNPITIYLAERIINFKSAMEFFSGRFATLLSPSCDPLIDGI